MKRRSTSAPLAATMVASLALVGTIAATPAFADDTRASSGTVADTTNPTVTVKPTSDGTVGTDGRYRSVSFKLYDAGMVDRVELNGVRKDLNNSKWSDLNQVKPGVFGAAEGKNTLDVYDVAGNVTSLDFVLDTTGPEVTVKDESKGADPVFRTVSFKLHDGAKVDRLELNGAPKDLSDNEWSDLNGVTPGEFGAVEGKNTLDVYDALGNKTTLVFTLDTMGPEVSVKPERDGTVGTDGRYASVSFKLHDAGKVDRLVLNGVDKDLSDSEWSDLNGVEPGEFGAVEGKNVLDVYDVAGNVTTLEFVLDTTGPEVTVKDESKGTDPDFRTVSFKLHDGAKVDKVEINGVLKDLTDNEWSDVNGVTPGTFGGVEGKNTLVAYDALGNATTVDFSLDTARPVVAIDAPAADRITTSAKAGTLTLTATDEQGLRRIGANLYRNGEFLRAVGSTSATAAIGETTWSGGWDIPVDLADGDYVIRTGATDLAGNWGGSDVALTIDGTKPEIIVPDGDQLAGAGETTFDLSQVEEHPDWSYVEIDQIGTNDKWQKITGQRFEGVNAYVFTVDGSALTEGVRTQVKITSVDAAGNRTSAVFPVVVDFSSATPVDPAEPEATPDAGESTEPEGSDVDGSGAEDTDDAMVLTLDGSRVWTETVDGLPWIDFDVTLTDPGAESTGHTVHLEITDGTHTEDITLGELVDGHLEGRILWPGAAEAAEGTPAAWPGWAQDSHGAWVRTDEGFAWTLGDITAKLVVNPELAVDLSYPAGAGPQVSDEAGETPSEVTDGDDVAVTGAEAASNVVADASTGAGADAADADAVEVAAGTAEAETTGALASTGFDVALVGSAALLLVVLGAGLVIARRRRA